MMHSSPLSRAERLHSAGALAEALKAYNAHLRDHPADTEILHRAAMISFQLGDLATATKALRRATELSPRNADYRNDLGAVHLTRKQWDLAERCFREALALKPDYVQVQNNLGHALVGAGRIDEAIECFRSLTVSAPAFVDAHFNLGKLLLQTGVLELAAPAFEAAIRLNPDLAVAQHHLGTVYAQLGRKEAAARCFRQALRSAPGYLASMLALAEVLTESGRVSEAIPLLDDALKLHPDDLTARLLLGRAREVSGDLAAAEGEYRRAIAQTPGSAGAWFGLSSARRFTAADQADIDALEHLVAQKQWDPSSESIAHFALGKMLDDCRRYDAAFAHYQAGNDLRKGMLGAVPLDVGGLTDAIIAQFTGTLFTELSGIGDDSDLPVVIVGMPRSGTTLTEQIIASHPAAHGAGELAYFPRVAHGLHVLLGTHEHFPLNCRALDASVARQVTKPYLDLLRWHSPDARRVTDKMPTNYRYLGLIALLFPNARFIHCERDAMDTCLSIYFQSFARGHEYSYDLAAIGEHYRHYRRLMAHWQQVLPGRIHTISYEALTADPESNARALIAACGLDWDDACLAFDRNRREVRTASVAQVREGIYTRSRERWRNYERHLEPLRAALGLE